MTGFKKPVQLKLICGCSTLYKDVRTYELALFGVHSDLSVA